MRRTVLHPDKGTEHLHEIAAEAAAKCYLQGGRQSDFAKYLKGALQSKDVEAPYLAEQNIKAIAEEVANALTRTGKTAAKDRSIVCDLFDREFRQIQDLVGRARVLGVKVPDMWLDLIQMCNRVSEMG